MLAPRSIWYTLAVINIKPKFCRAAAAKAHAAGAPMRKKTPPLGNTARAQRARVLLACDRWPGASSAPAGRTRHGKQPRAQRTNESTTPTNDMPRNIMQTLNHGRVNFSWAPSRPTLHMEYPAFPKMVLAAPDNNMMLIKNATARVFKQDAEAMAMAR